MHLRVFHYFLITNKNIPIINAFNRKITLNTSFRSHVVVGHVDHDIRFFERWHLKAANIVADTCDFAVMILAS